MLEEFENNNIKILKLHRQERKCDNLILKIKTSVNIGINLGHSFYTFEHLKRRPNPNIFKCSNVY